MNQKDKAIALDKILIKFNPFGEQKFFTMDETKFEKFYKTIDNDYNFVRILMDFLEMDGQLYISKPYERIEVTPKGAATIFDIENLDYVSKYKKETNQNKFNWIILIIGILTLIATIVGVVLGYVVKG